MLASLVNPEVSKIFEVMAMVMVMVMTKGPNNYKISQIMK